MKIRFSLFAVAALLLMASCSKNNECECTSVQEWVNHEEETITGISNIKVGKGTCSDRNTTERLTDKLDRPYIVTVTCKEI